MQECVWMYVCMYVCMNVSMYLSKYAVCMDVWMYVCMYECIYVPISVCMHWKWMRQGWGIYVCIKVSVYLSLYVHGMDAAGSTECVCMYVHAYIPAHIFIFMCDSFFVYMYAWIKIQALLTYACIHINTCHTETRQSWIDLEAQREMIKSPTIELYMCIYIHMQICWCVESYALCVEVVCMCV